jgi:hypothetical protein
VARKTDVRYEKADHLFSRSAVSRERFDHRYPNSEPTLEKKEGHKKRAEQARVSAKKADTLAKTHTKFVHGDHHR